MLAFWTDDLRVLYWPWPGEDDTGPCPLPSAGVRPCPDGAGEIKRP